MICEVDETRENTQKWGTDSILTNSLRHKTRDEKYYPNYPIPQSSSLRLFADGSLPSQASQPIANLCSRIDIGHIDQIVVIVTVMGHAVAVFVIVINVTSVVIVSVMLLIDVLMSMRMQRQHRLRLIDVVGEHPHFQLATFHRIADNADNIVSH